MLDLERLPDMYVNWRERWAERDERHAIIDAVMAGDFNQVDEDEEELKSRSPNMVQVAAEDTSEAASLVPTVRVQATKTGSTAKKAAAEMEFIAAGYYDVNDIDMMIPRSVLDMSVYGLHAWTVEPDLKDRSVKIDRKDPRFVYPEPGWRAGDPARRVMLVRTVYMTSLPHDYQARLLTKTEVAEFQENEQVVLIEYYDEDEYVLAGLIGDSTRYTAAGTEVSYIPSSWSASRTRWVSVRSSLGSVSRSMGSLEASSTRWSTFSVATCS
jgi:hypothetical protein